MKVAYTVLTGGKSVKIYLSELGRGINFTCLKHRFAIHSPCLKAFYFNNKTPRSLYNKRPGGIVDLPARSYSTNVEKPTFLTNLSLEFIEWFRGFTDGEGSFYIQNTKGYQFQFYFEISLHIDDLGVLTKIKDSLGIGKIYIKNNKVTYLVRNLPEIQLIINIFAQNPLNTIKHINFLDFQKAYLLYTKKGIERDMLKESLLRIKKSMNKGRIDYDLDKDHIINITSNWLLGFIEAEGSFSYSLLKNTFVFIITQKGNLPLMEAIKDFLEKRCLETGHPYLMEDKANSPVIVYSKDAAIIPEYD